MPDGVEVNVVENTDNTVHITMPVAPAGTGELSDEELINAAGGHNTVAGLCYTGHPKDGGDC